MKFLLINSFRMMVYIFYFTGLAVTFGLAWFNAVPENGDFARDMFGTDGVSAQIASFMVIAGIGFVIVTVIAGLLMTILDIRDDINDRLPDARRDI